MFSVYKFFSLGKIGNYKKQFYIQYITVHMVLKSTHPKTHEKLAFLLEGIRGQVDSDNSILTIFESTVYTRYNRHVHILHFKTRGFFAVAPQNTQFIYIYSILQNDSAYFREISCSCQFQTFTPRETFLRRSTHFFKQNKIIIKTTGTEFLINFSTQLGTVNLKSNFR